MVIITTGSIGEQLGEMVCGEPGHYFGWSACNCDNLFGNLGNNGSGLIIASDLKFQGDVLLSWANREATILGMWEDEKNRNHQYYFCS